MPSIRKLFLSRHGQQKLHNGTEEIVGGDSSEQEQEQEEEQEREQNGRNGPGIGGIKERGKRRDHLYGALKRRLLGVEKSGRQNRSHSRSRIGSGNGEESEEKNSTSLAATTAATAVATTSSNTPVDVQQTLVTSTTATPQFSIFKHFTSVSSRMGSSAAKIPTVPAGPVETVERAAESNPTTNSRSGIISEIKRRKDSLRRLTTSVTIKTIARPNSPTLAPKEPLPSPLTQSDLIELFSGAPQFSLRLSSSSSPLGLASVESSTRIPTITFPHTIPSIAANYLSFSDHVRFPLHPSFALCASASSSRKPIDILDPLPSELPPMSAFQGLEPGTCGWEYFILNPLGDLHASVEGDDDTQSIDLVDAGGRERGARARGRLLSGVMRSVDVGYIIERLKELGELYWIDSQKEEVNPIEEGISDIHSTTPPQPPEKISTTTSTLENSGSTPSAEDSKSFASDNGGSINCEGQERSEREKKKSGILSKYTALELYTQLFTRILYPPTSIETSDYHDPYSLKVQIAALTKALGIKRVWLNFSLVEWRIRLGQVLWGGNWARIREDVVDGGLNINTERVWLLLQILLACELVVRLDAVASAEVREGDAPTIGGLGAPGESKEELFKYFREIRNKKVEWDIILARRWLENVYLVEREKSPSPTPSTSESQIPFEKLSTSPKKKGWFSALSAAETPPPVGGSEIEKSIDNWNPAYDALVIPRNQETQLSGLLYFARYINWPDADSLSQSLIDSLLSYVKRHHIEHGYPASPTSPLPEDVMKPLQQYSSGTSSPSNTKPSDTGRRPNRVREISKTSVRSKSSSILLRKRSSHEELMRNNTIGYGGWLSRSWFTGLVLPGESMVHLLISTLLENDLFVSEKVGWDAELYGGFVLADQIDGEGQGRSMWWSSFCIVGKILGGFGGGKECMGWIAIGKGVKVISATEHMLQGDPLAGSVDVTGWIAVHTKELGHSCENEAGTIARIEKPREVGKMSCILGRGWREGTSVMNADFTTPKLDEFDMLEQIELEGLIFRPSTTTTEAILPEDSVTEIEAGVRSYDVDVSFVLTERYVPPMSPISSPPMSPISPRLEYDGLNNLIINGKSRTSPQNQSLNRTKKIAFRLAHDITFITAYPCFPPSMTTGEGTREQQHITYAHPLHNSHVYTTHLLSSLPALHGPPPISQVAASAMVSPKKNNGSPSTMPPIMVIDASKYGEEGEVFAKAWCSEKGVGAAIVGRDGRGCLGCCIREAGGLGVGVVIWCGRKDEKGEGTNSVKV